MPLLRRPDFLSSLVLAIGLAPAYGGAADAPPDTWVQVRRAGVLKCGAATSPPYVMHDAKTGRHYGFFPDLCREFAEQVLRVQAQFVPTRWDSIVAETRDGRFDLGMSLNVTPERAALVNFSAGVSVYQISFVYNKRDPMLAAEPRKLSDLDRPDISIAVAAGTSMEATAASVFQHARLQRYPSVESARAAVVGKKAHVLMDASDTNWLFSEVHSNWAKTFTPVPALARQDVAFAVRKSLPPRDLAVLDAFIQERSRSGQITELVKLAVKYAAIDAVRDALFASPARGEGAAGAP